MFKYTWQYMRRLLRMWRSIGLATWPSTHPQTIRDYIGMYNAGGEL